MKSTRFFTIAVIAALLPFAGFAQIALGVRGGAAFATARATETLAQFTPDYKYTTGWDVAGVAEINFGKVFALQPEIHWVQKGFQFDEGTGLNVGNFPIPIGVNATFRTNYLELPLLAKVKLGNDLVQGYAAVGPSFGYALNAKIITRPRLLVELDPITTDLDFDSFDYNRFEVSGTGVLGVQFNFNGVKVFADARYTHGFTELYDVPVVNEQLKNSNFSAGAGVLIDLNQPAKAKPRPAARRK